MVFAVEESVENITEGADVMEVIQDDYSGQLGLTLLCVTLLGQTREVQSKILLLTNTKHTMD